MRVIVMSVIHDRRRTYDFRCRMVADINDRLPMIVYHVVTSADHVVSSVDHMILTVDHVIMTIKGVIDSTYDSYPTVRMLVATATSLNQLLSMFLDGMMAIQLLWNVIQLRHLMMLQLLVIQLHLLLVVMPRRRGRPLSLLLEQIASFE